MQNLSSNLRDKIFNQLFFYKKNDLYPDSNQVTSLQRQNFEQKYKTLALEVFRYQSINNPIYRQWLKHIHCEAKKVKCIHEIPFLPISVFKASLIKTGQWKEEVIFKSSGTTGQQRSLHAVNSLAWYHRLAKHCFEFHFGSLDEYTFLALLPAYLENKNSSLIHMIDFFLKENSNPHSRYFLDKISRLPQYLSELRKNKRNKKIILWGVTYAITDLSAMLQEEKLMFPNLSIIETGGMKGRKEEIIRKELHQQIIKNIGVPYVSSEYGMTELLSQAYAMKRGIYHPPPVMKIYVRNPYDPLDVTTYGRGCLNIIDLGNVDTCAFIGTDDIGKLYVDGSFEVLGRLDASDIRGCSLLY